MGDNKCSHEGCEFDVYEESSKCVLHCEKKKKYDYRDKEIYEDFNEALICNIAQKIEACKNNKYDDVIIDEQSAIKILNGKSFQTVFHNDEWMIDVAKNAFFTTVNFDYVIFPDKKASDDFNYERVLRKLKAVQFNKCHFNTNNIQLDGIKCFFNDCKFHVPWTLLNYAILENEYNTIYQACKFYDNVSNYTLIDRKSFAHYDVSQFDYTCKFEKELSFSNVKFKNPLFYAAQKNYLEDRNFIKVLTFSDCTFEQSFRLNNYQIDDFTCTDTVFKQVADFSNTVFYKNNFTNTLFEDTSSFIESKFCDDVDFKYTVFEKLVIFKKAIFEKSINLEDSIIKGEANFLNITSRNKKINIANKETARIIKHSFDKVGNTIEANKYFAYEMKKEREAISIKEDFDKKTMLNLNYWISDFGQSWVKAFIWILGIALLHYFIVKGTFQCISPSNFIYEPLKLLGDFFDDLANSIIPFRKFIKSDKEGMEFINLIFLIVYSTLIYNLVIAVKRITKR